MRLKMRARADDNWILFVKLTSQLGSGAHPGSTQGTSTPASIMLLIGLVWRSLDHICNNDGFATTHKRVLTSEGQV
jgi:hypothetical protein